MCIAHTPPSLSFTVPSSAMPNILCFYHNFHLHLTGKLEVESPTFVAYKDLAKFNLESTFFMMSSFKCSFV